MTVVECCAQHRGARLLRSENASFATHHAMAVAAQQCVRRTVIADVESAEFSFLSFLHAIADVAHHGENDEITAIAHRSEPGAPYFLTVEAHVSVSGHGCHIYPVQCIDHNPRDDALRNGEGCEWLVGTILHGVAHSIDVDAGGIGHRQFHFDIRLVLAVLHIQDVFVAVHQPRVVSAIDESRLIGFRFLVQPQFARQSEDGEILAEESPRSVVAAYPSGARPCGGTLLVGHQASLEP